MKNRIIFLIGTIVFLAVLSMTVQFDSNSSDGNNNLAIKNLEALAGGSYYCSNGCYSDMGSACTDCNSCDAVYDMAPANPVSTCGKPGQT